MSNTLVKKSKKAVELPERKRPNKAILEQLGEQRGYFTASEKLALKGLEVKNALQRINNRTLAKTALLTGTDCAKLQKAMNIFLKSVKEII